MEKINEFLQSNEWRRFQEAVGRKTFHISDNDFYASIIEHKLPIAGKYFYIPRGPMTSPVGEEFPISIRQLADQFPNKSQNSKFKIQNSFSELISLARKSGAGWIRIEPANEEILDLIQKNVGNALVHSENRNAYMRSLHKYKIIKAPHDMQPREILVMDITKPEEELLAEMKAKTRYNVKLSQKHGVLVKVLTNNRQLTTDNYLEEFIKLVKVTAKRDKITPHPESYYRKMFETIPENILKLYVAEYQNKIIAANIVIHYGDTAIYLHGTSDDEYRNVMAPHLLQWRAMQDAKKAGLNFYDLGGVKTTNNLQLTTNNWDGITRFKTGFAPNTKPVVFPGSYDIIINPVKYNLYRIIQKIKGLL